MKLILAIFFSTLIVTCFAQLKNLGLNENKKVIEVYDSTGKSFKFGEPPPLISFQLGEKAFTTDTKPATLEISFDTVSFSPGIKGILTFTNKSARDTLRLNNVVPFGVSESRVYITGKGDHPLSRSHLFIPGKIPVNVILPDNAWELGYSSAELVEGKSIAALVRRDPSSLQKATRRRFETLIYPGGSVKYNFFADLFEGDWQEGMTKIFQERLLYDLPSFDSTLYLREDLKWIRHSYVMHLIMAWDKVFENGKMDMSRFIERGKRLYGGDEVIGIWPTWPTLGLDQRNQFDLFRDLPGGTKNLRVLADSLRANGSKFFVCYNPWDESTRSEGHLAGLADLVKETSADGVVLDTRGESSKELQSAVDAVRPGVVMYSEGMSVPKNMPGIVSGRVHNALYYPPMLNLNKLIKPDFAIFRVAEVFKEPIKREYAVSFFNGYGTEINQFAPGHPEWEDDQYRFLGKTSRILRENTMNFTYGKLTPLITTRADSVWVNRWTYSDRIIYTIFSTVPEGVSKPLFEVDLDTDHHLVDLWNHEEVVPVTIDGKHFAAPVVHGFDQKFLGTNNEGEIGCVARFQKLLYSLLDGDDLRIFTNGGDHIKVWMGDPSYEKIPLIVDSGPQQISLSQNFGRYEGKFVIQLFESSILVDENIVFVAPGTPRLISQTEKTKIDKSSPAGMVKIPSGKFVFRSTHGDEFIRYPNWNEERIYNIPQFFIDKFPVTNRDYYEFVQSSKYVPSDTNNYLKHWQNGKPKKGEEKFPVTYISYEDAQSYAIWAGKRLPTEIEWQYAAQTSSGNEWPWKQTTPVTRKEEVVTETLTVTSIQGIDKKHANLGDGKLYPVGKYPKGANPFGVQDLVGCVWQLTNDLYQSGSYQYIMLKGGSYFKPSSSWWYVQGGPRELHYRQFLLRVSQGFERNATVGFRCVKDAE